jgi:glyoxalase family protein
VVDGPGALAAALLRGLVERDPAAALGAAQDEAIVLAGRAHQPLEELMGATRDDDRFVLRGAKRGGWIAFDPAPDERGRQSGGTVHHVAWGTYDADLLGWIERIDEARIPNSGYVDRHYFHSLYFREPGGVLYELATEEPGFLVDGLDVSELGTKIILPPFLEDRREQIEARLTPLPDPRAGWTPVAA